MRRRRRHRRRRRLVSPKTSDNVLIGSRLEIKISFSKGPFLRTGP